MANHPTPSVLVFPSVSKPAETVMPGALKFQAAPKQLVQPVSKPEQDAASVPEPIKFAANPFTTLRRQPERTVQAPTSIFAVTKTSEEVVAIQEARMQYPELFKIHEERIERQITQLLPLRLEFVMQWGSGSIERVSQLSGNVSRLATDFSQAEATETVEAALMALKKSTNKTLLSKLSRKPMSVKEYVPVLKAIQARLYDWLPKCVELQTTAEKAHTDVSIKMVALSVAANSLSDMSDASLYNACTNRRVMCQQSVQMATMLTIQLQQLHQQIVEAIARVDQFVQITIPAFLNASNNS